MNTVLKEGQHVVLNNGAYGRFEITTNSNGELVVGAGLRVQRIRRVTGYLTGSLDRFNDAKKAEVRERVKHVRV